MFKFATLKDALDFIKRVNEGEGIPTEGAVTSTYCEPIEDEESNEWMIPKDEVTTKYMNDEN